MEPKNGAHTHTQALKTKNTKKKLPYYGHKTAWDGKWLILSPRCEPGSLAHLFWSFAKQAFSVGIWFFFPLLFLLFLCSFTLGTVSQARSQSFLYNND